MTMQELFGKSQLINFVTLKKNLLVLLLALSFGNVFAQKQFTVLNAQTNNPVNFVKIYSDELEIASANDRGLFSLEAKYDSSEIIVKAMGYESVSLNLKSASKSVIYLTPVMEMLSEVIVKSVIIPNKIQDIPASINIVNSTDFRRSDATNVLESLVNVPGVFVNQGALNTNKLNIRGIGSRSQYSTNRIQAFYDGIPLTTGEGDLTLDDFDQESLSRIEIIKGPSSSIYGAGLGGSINLYSNSFGETKSNIKLSTKYGSFNTEKQVFQTSNATENSIVNFTLSSLQSDGYRENGNYDRKSGLLNGSIRIGAISKLSYIANFTRLKAFIPSSINEDDFINNPQSAASAWKQSQGFESYDRGLFGGSYTQQFSDTFTNVTTVFVSFKNAFEPRPFDILKDESVSAGVRTQFNYQTQLFKRKSEFSFGANYYNEWFETGTFANLYQDFPDTGSVLGNRLSNNQQERNYYNVFAQINIDITDQWNFEAGVNVNRTSYTLRDFYNRDATNQSGDYNFDVVFSPRIGTSYEIYPGKNFYATVSQGFSIPTVSETLTPDGQINTELKPEMGTNFEIGFKGNWLNNKLYTEVSAYSIQIDNLLVANRIAEDQYVGINAGKSNHNGIEMLSNYNFAVANSIIIKPYFSLALNFFEFDEFINDGDDFSGNKLPGVPEYSSNIGIDTEINKGLVLSANYRSVGKMALNDANSDYSDTFNVLSFKAGYSFKVLKNLSFSIYSGINNLLDEKYAASILTNAIGFGNSAPRYYYPGNPRNYYAGFQVTLNL